MASAPRRLWTGCQKGKLDEGWSAGPTAARPLGGGGAPSTDPCLQPYSRTGRAHAEGVDSRSSRNKAQQHGSGVHHAFCLTPLHTRALLPAMATASGLGQVEFTGQQHVGYEKCASWTPFLRHVKKLNPFAATSKPVTVSGCVGVESRRERVWSANVQALCYGRLPFGSPPSAKTQSPHLLFLVAGVPLSAPAFPQSLVPFTTGEQANSTLLFYMWLYVSPLHYCALHFCSI